MAVLMAAMLNPLPLVPLAPQLVLQAYAVAMIRSNNTLCATPLLSAPLSAQRIHRFHSLLHALSHVLPGEGYRGCQVRGLLCCGHAGSHATPVRCGATPPPPPACSRNHPSNRWRGPVHVSAAEAFWSPAGGRMR